MTGWALAPWIALDSLVMVYLVGVVVVAARYGRGPSIVAAVASAVAFDFFFTLPFFSLRIADPRLVITVGVMLFVGLVISELTSALRERDRAAVDHARRVRVLYSLTRDLARATDDAHIYQAARRHSRTRRVFLQANRERVTGSHRSRPRTFGLRLNTHRDCRMGIPPSAPGGDGYDAPPGR